MFELKLENESGNIVDINDDKNYVVLSVSGLSPPSASLFTSKSPNRKGVKYNGSTLDERNIVIDIKIKGDVEANRNALYGWIDTEQYCKIRYRNGVKNVYCEGYVQECDIDLFTDNEVVSVAIVCPDPYWKDLAEIRADISLLLKQFTLPFAISAAGVPFSTMRANNATTIFNAGAETGVKITVRCKSDIVNLTIYDARDTAKRFVLKTTLKSGSVAEIDTEASPKTVKVTNSDGSVTNLMRYIGGNPTWFTLKKGINQFAYTADAGLNDAEITVGFSYKFAGV